MGDIERHLLVFGQVRFPKGGAAAWRKLRVDEGAWDDWPDVLEGGHLGRTTVGDALAAIAGMNDEQGAIEIGAAGAVVKVCGFFLEPGTMAWSRDVAAALRAAAGAKAKGEVVFLPITGEGGVRLVLDGRSDRLETLEPDEAMELLGCDGAAEASTRYAAASGVPAQPELIRPKEARGIHAAIRDRIRDALAALPHAELHRLALAQLTLCTGPGQWTPTKTLFPRAEDARSYYGGLASDTAVESGFNLVAQARPHVARPLAAEILRSGVDGPLTMASCGVLRDAEDTSAVSALLDHAAPLAGPWPRILQGDVSTALASAKLADADPMLRERLAALEPREEAAEAVLRLARVLHDRGALDDATRSRLAGRFPGLLWLAPVKPAKRASPSRSSATKKVREDRAGAALPSGPHEAVRDGLRHALASIPDDELHRLALAQGVVDTGGGWTEAAKLFPRPADARRFFESPSTDAVVEAAFALLVTARPEVARPLGVAILRTGHDGLMAVLATSLLVGAAEPESLDVLLDYAAPADRAAPASLRADTAFVLRLPDLSAVLASSSAPDADARILARLDALIDREDALPGLNRLVQALIRRGSLDPERSARLARRFPKSFGHLRRARPAKGASTRSPTKATAGRK